MSASRRRTSAWARAHGSYFLAAAGGRTLRKKAHVSNRIRSRGLLPVRSASKKPPLPKKTASLMIHYQILRAVTIGETHNFCCENIFSQKTDQAGGFSGKAQSNRRKPGQSEPTGPHAETGSVSDVRMTVRMRAIGGVGCLRHDFFSLFVFIIAQSNHFVFGFSEKMVRFSWKAKAFRRRRSDGGRRCAKKESFGARCFRKKSRRDFRFNRSCARRPALFSIQQKPGNLRFPRFGLTGKSYIEAAASASVARCAYAGWPSTPDSA